MYFDQLASLRMHSHGRKQLKTLENHEKNFFLHFSSCALHEHRGHDKKILFIIFECFSLFSTMQTHVQACIRWSKYTTEGGSQISFRLALR